MARGATETSALLGGLTEVDGRGSATHLGDALVHGLSGHRGRPVTDVVVVSDGRSNGGLPVPEGARSLAAAGKKKKAEKLWKRSLEKLKKKQGENHPALKNLKLSD